MAVRRLPAREKLACSRFGRREGKTAGKKSLSGDREDEPAIELKSLVRTACQVPPRLWLLYLSARYSFLDSCLASFLVCVRRSSMFASIRNLRRIVKGCVWGFYPVLAVKPMKCSGSFIAFVLCPLLQDDRDHPKASSEQSTKNQVQRTSFYACQFCPGQLVCLNVALPVNMLHQNTLELTRSALAIIDMQEAFRARIRTLPKLPLESRGWRGRPGFGLADNCH